MHRIAGKWDGRWNRDTDSVLQLRVLLTSFCLFPSVSYAYCQESRSGFIAFPCPEAAQIYLSFMTASNSRNQERGRQGMPGGWDHGAGIAYRSDTKESGSPGDHKLRDIIRAADQIFHIFLSSSSLLFLVVICGRFVYRLSQNKDPLTIADRSSPW